VTEKVVCVIPARYHATRFPGKVLADLKGKPVIRHVYERVLRAEGVDRVLIATDDERILKAVEKFGGEAVSTPSDLPSGTDRVARALEGRDAGIVINVQGDEPLIDPVSVERLVRVLLEDSGVRMASVMCPILSEELYGNPNVVKVVVDEKGDALYFSRAPIPHSRSGEFPPCFQHVGIYGFRRKTLDEFVSWEPSLLEETEKLEQLRALEHGIRIRMVQVPGVTVGVDTPEDLERVRRIMTEQPGDTTDA
jgi:3-deoxy-manno-octulosonate cytidylyltransferase (CMP-KDO synthetase)